MYVRGRDTLPGNRGVNMQALRSLTGFTRVRVEAEWTNTWCNNQTMQLEDLVQVNKMMMPVFGSGRFY